MMPFVPPIFAAPSPVVTLSGETVLDDITGGTKIAGIIFRADGDVLSLIGAVGTPIDTATDWVRPSSFADGTYEVRYTSPTGTWTTSAAAENTWISLSTDRQWDVRQGSGSTKVNSVTFEIRKDGGAVLDSATYTCTADDS